MKKLVLVALALVVVLAIVVVGIGLGSVYEKAARVAKKLWEKM